MKPVLEKQTRQSGNFPPERDTDITPINGMCEIRTTPSMGKGVFASCNIARGTRILADAPILTLPPVDSTPDNDLIPVFCSALSHLPREKKDELDGLHRLGASKTKEITDRVREWCKTNASTGADGKKLNSKGIQDKAKGIMKRFDTFLTNQVDMDSDKVGMGGKGPGKGAVYGTGVFQHFSRVNHSCIPNVYHSYNPTIQRLTVHATRGIKAGEQLLANYIGTTCAAKETRRVSLEARGVICDCVACTSPEIEIKRRRMADLRSRVLAYKLGHYWNSKSPSHFPPPQLSHEEALEAAQEVEALLKEQGLEGWDLIITLALSHPNDGCVSGL